MCLVVTDTNSCLMFDLFTRSFSAKLLSVLLALVSAVLWGYSVPGAELAFAFELPGILSAHFSSLQRLL